MERIAVLTSGGDAPGMNAAIRAITRSAIEHGLEVYGVRHGFQGLIDDALGPLRARDVGGIVQRGGTFLGSARSLEFREPSGRVRALRCLSQHGIEALIVIGGNGSQSGAHALSGMGFPVIGVASTIDNDLLGTDVTIGVDTAINVTLEAIDRLRTTGSSHQRAFLVETMGRDCGYIALMAGVAGGAEVISIPEREVSPEEVAQRLSAAYQRGKTHAIVVVAEGATHGTDTLMNYFREHKEAHGFDLRATTLGHVVRGAAPSAADRLLATRLGVHAVEQLVQGNAGVLCGWFGGALAATPLSEIAGRTKPVDATLLELARILAK